MLQPITHSIGVLMVTGSRLMLTIANSGKRLVYLAMSWRLAKRSAR